MIKRWHTILYPSPQSFEWYELDTVNKIKNVMPEFAHLSFSEIARLWEAYSQRYCAHWLDSSNDDNIEDFRNWCHEVVY